MSSKVSKLHLVTEEGEPQGEVTPKTALQLIRANLGVIEKMTDIECYKNLMLVHEVLGWEIPRALPTKRGLVVFTSNELELDDFKTVRETLKNILSDALVKL